MATRLGGRFIDFAACWMNESGLNPAAQNPHGFASGLNQLMPDTARKLGWRAGDMRWEELDRIRRALEREDLSAEQRKALVARAEQIKLELMASYIVLPIQEQLVWVERYYRPHAGLLTSAGAVYLATFLPAYMTHAGDPTFVLCGKRGPHAEWYAANRTLDANGDGFIVVQDLTDKVAQSCVGPRWTEFAARIKAATQAADTSPELPPCDDEQGPQS